MLWAGRDYDILGDAIPDQEAPIPRLRQAGKSWGHLTDPGSAMLPRRESSDDWAMPCRLPQSLGYQDVNLGVPGQVYPRSFTLSSGYEVDSTLRFAGSRDGELSPIRATSVMRSASPLTTVYSLPAQVYTRQPSPIASVSTSGLSVTRPAYTGPMEATSYSYTQVAAPKSFSQGKYMSWSPGSGSWTNYSSSDRAGECGRSEGALSSAVGDRDDAGKQESVDQQGVRVSQQTKAYPAVRYYAAGLTDSQQLQTVAALGATYTAAPLPCASVSASATAYRSPFQRLHAGKQESVDQQGVPQKSSLPSVDSLASAPPPLPLSLGQPPAYPAVRYYAAGLTDSQQLQTVAALGTTYTAAPLPCATSSLAPWAAHAPVATGRHVRSISWSPCTVTDLPVPAASQDGWLAQNIPASSSPLPPRIGSVSPLKCLPVGCTRREWAPEAPRPLQGSLSRCVSWSPDTMVVEPVPMDSQALPYSKDPSDAWFAPNILASSSSLPPRIGSGSPLKCMPAAYTRHEWDPEAKGQAPHPPAQAVPKAANFPQLLAEERSRLQQKVDAAAAVLDVYDVKQPNAEVSAPMEAEGASCLSALSPSQSSPATSPAPITSTKKPSSGLAKLKVDHFGTFSGTFAQRYCVFDKWWRPALQSGFNVSSTSPGPIFFYTGNESPVGEYVNNTGLMWELGEKMGALLVFAEHRCEPDSHPIFKGDSCPRCVSYCTTAQALEDYAAIMSQLRQQHVQRAPVIVFGGSYGGMLSGWMRMKYPEVVDGAIAASAPIWQLSTTVTRETVDWPAVAISRGLSSAGGSSEKCLANLQVAWPLLRGLESPIALQLLGRHLNTCAELESIESLTSWAAASFFLLAEGNYPYPSSYITYAVGSGSALPAWPMRVACRGLSGDFGIDVKGSRSDVNYTARMGALQVTVDWTRWWSNGEQLTKEELQASGILELAAAVTDAAGVWYNASGDQSCWNISSGGSQVPPQTRQGLKLARASAARATSAASAASCSACPPCPSCPACPVSRCAGFEPPCNFTGQVPKTFSWDAIVCNDDLSQISAQGLGRDLYWPPSVPFRNFTIASMVGPRQLVPASCTEHFNAMGLRGAPVTTDPWSGWLTAYYGGRDALLAESKLEEPAIRRPSDTLELSLKAIQSNLSGRPATQTPLPLPPLPALPSRYFTPPRVTSDLLTLSKSESTGRLDGPGEAKDYEGKTPCSVSSGTTVDPQRLLRMDQESEFDLATQKPKVEFSQQPEMAASQASGLQLPTEPVTASFCQSRPSWTPPACPVNERGAPDPKPTRSQSVPTGLDLGQREVAEELKEKDGDPSNPRGAGDIAGGWSHFKAKAALHASDLAA
eukprot:s790_g5.t1